MTTLAPDRLDPRFRSKFTVNDRTGCWEWTAALHQTGYGKYWGGVTIGRVVPAHRYAYEALVGPIPEGLQIDHLCRVRCCVNPDHLEPVTCRENLLRGMGVSAKAAQATHCPAGHPYAGDNLYRSPQGHRGCKACRDAQARESAERTRARLGVVVGTPNAAKTHCPQGHEYTAQNTYTDKRNRRSCKKCAADRRRASVA